MINIVVVSHGELAQSLVGAAQMIAGEQEQLYAVSLLEGESPDSFGAKLEETLAPLAGQPTLVLIDLFGGTPYNQAARQVRQPGIECVTGASLPMLLEVLMGRDECSVAELAEMAAQAGPAGVKNLRPLLVKR